MLSFEVRSTVHTELLVKFTMIIFIYFIFSLSQVMGFEVLNNLSADMISIQEEERRQAKDIEESERDGDSEDDLSMSLSHGPG